VARKGKQSELTYQHLATGIKIKTAPYCQNCVYRIYATEEQTVTLGTGNIHSNFIFVLPTYDLKSKVGYDNLLSLLADTYHNIVGRSIFEDIYITRLVKCSNKAEHNIYESAVSCCDKYLIYEMTRLTGKHVVFFGSSYDDYYNNNCATVGTHPQFKTIHKLYSPAVMFYDNDKLKQKFIDDLTNILSYN